MGLGSTAKKIQMLSDSAEKMYRQVQEMQGRIVGLEEEVDETHETVTKLDDRVAEQRALLVAIAENQGLDAEAILAEAAIEDAEADDGSGQDGDSSGEDGDATGDAGDTRGDGGTTTGDAGDTTSDADVRTETDTSATDG